MDPAPLLTTIFIFRYILGDMEKAYLVLDSSAKPFFADNPHADSQEYTTQMAQTVLLFHLKALSDLGSNFFFVH